MQPLKIEKRIAELTTYLSAALNMIILCSLIFFINKFKLGMGDIFSSSGLLFIALYCLVYSIYYYFGFIRFWFFKKYKNNKAHVLWLHSILNHGLFFIYTTWAVHLFLQSFSYLLFLAFLPNFVLIGLSLAGLIFNNKSFVCFQH